MFTLVQGTEPSLADIHGWTWLEGQGFTDADVTASAAKVVLGRIASARLFGEGVDPTGRKVTIHDRQFEVVGLMRAVDADQDEAAFVPVTTLGALTSRTSGCRPITVGVTEAGVATSVGDAITALLRERHALEHPRDRGARLGRARRTAVARRRQRPDGPGRRLHGEDAGRARR